MKINCRYIFNSKFFLFFEFTLLCIALPSYIIYFKQAKFMFFFLWSAALYAACVVFAQKNNDVWKFNEINRENLKVIIPRFLLACLGMITFLYFYDPARLFEIVLNRPFFVPFLFFAYPILSAFPQELIFCSFFFHRYAPIFKSEKSKIIASTIVFAYAHILYINIVAPSLSLIAGLIFASTYSKTRSLSLVTLEHALYGNALFIIGLGWYFWHGSVH